MKIKDIIEHRLKIMFGDSSFHIIAIAITGSNAYGMQTKDSDLDIIGIFLPPVEYILGVKQIEQVIINKNIDGFEGTMFSFSKWYNLLIKQNPNILELLWHEEHNYIYKDNKYFNWLLENRKELLSKQLKHSYSGYAYRQMQKLKSLNEKVNQNKKRLEEFEKFGYSVKNASHAFRLLNMCLDGLIEGEIKVMRPEKQFLRAIREGKYTYDEISKMAYDKMKLIDEAYIRSNLKNKINMEFANNLHLKILKDYIGIN